MTDEVLEKVIATYMRTSQPHHIFTWQGGEPTLMGIDFFKKAVALQKKYAGPGTMISNSLQTNGTLIDDDWAAFLAEHRFLVGASLDGPAYLHDAYRVSSKGKPTHDRVIKGISLLEKHNVEFNILTLVNSKNVHNPVEVYDYLVERGFYFHQYIPCVENDQKGRPRPFAITGNEWGRFLCGIFDRWMEKKDQRKVSIRHFDSILEYMVMGTRNVCTMGTFCNPYFLVEHTGDVYPCDFFAEPGLKLGNIMETGWQNLRESEKYARFGENKTKFNGVCQNCQFLDLCMGDCPKHRHGQNKKSFQVSSLCQGWKQFFGHTQKEFKALAKMIQHEQAPNPYIIPPEPSGPPISDRKIGRNRPCPCGSGKKYKKCCGN